MYPSHPSPAQPARIPVWKKQHLRELLAALDVPDCDCPLEREHVCPGDCDPDAYCTCCLAECHCRPKLYQPPCWHVRQTAAHALSVQEWAALLLICGFDDYRERPLPIALALVPPGPARARAGTRPEEDGVLMKRARLDEALWHPADVTSEDFARIGRHASRGRNGAVIAGELCAEAESRKPIEVMRHG